VRGLWGMNGVQGVSLHYPPGSRMMESGTENVVKHRMYGLDEDGTERVPKRCQLPLVGCTAIAFQWAWKQVYHSTA
jgi:hypothetical protein